LVSVSFAIIIEKDVENAPLHSQCGYKNHKIYFNELFSLIVALIIALSLLFSVFNKVNICQEFE